MKISHKTLIFFIGMLGILSLCSVVQATNPSEIPYLNDLPWIGGFAAGLGLLACCLLFLIPLIIAILICIWLYKDAEARGKSGILWVLLLLIASVFFNILGLIVVLVIWLIVRPKEKG
jgi:hypothetical protein